MTMKDGGPAFPDMPALYARDPDGPVRLIPGQSGMTLRDYFAAHAMIALHASDARGGMWNEGSATHCAKNAYAMADAMIAARTTNENTPSP